MGIAIRAATPSDVPLLLALVRELAAYEREPDAVQATAANLHSALFGERPAAEAVVVRHGDDDVAFALFFTNFSTWSGKPGLYLEDLFVRPQARGLGIGRALLVHLAELAVTRGYGRFEWSVLDWNEPAIGFYKALGARAMDAWTIMRIDGPTLTALAASPSADAI